MGKSKDEPAPTAQEGALAEIGTKSWNRFVTDMAPSIGRFVSLTRGSASDRRDIGAQASGMAARELQAFRPRAGKGASVQQAYDASALATSVPATAAAEGKAELDDRAMRGLISASAIGRGIGDQGMRGLAEAGSRATSSAMEKVRRNQETRQGLISGAASVVGGYGQSQGWFTPRK